MCVYTCMVTFKCQVFKILIKNRNTSSEKMRRLDELLIVWFVAGNCWRKISTQICKIFNSFSKKCASSSFCTLDTEVEHFFVVFGNGLDITLNGKLLNVDGGFGVVLYPEQTHFQNQVENTFHKQQCLCG